MKGALLLIIFFATSIFIQAQVYTNSEEYSVTYRADWYEEPNIYHVDGNYGSINSSSYAYKLHGGAFFIYFIYQLCINAEVGEIIITNIEDEITCLVTNHTLSLSQTSSLAKYEKGDSIIYCKIEEDGYVLLNRTMQLNTSYCDEIDYTDIWSDEDFDSLTQIELNDLGDIQYYPDSAFLAKIPEEYNQFSLTVQKIGNIVSLELLPVDDVTYSSVSQYIAAMNLSSSTNETYIKNMLSSGIECVATDTYGQRIYLLCPTYSWDVDIDAGVATYTPYFTPRNYSTDWTLDESIECSFSSSATETTKSLLLWGSNPISKTEADNFTIIGGEGNITITNNPGIEIYDIAGSLIYKGTDAIVNVPQGVYIIVAGERVEKVIVR